jgi:hypothetical protein
MIYAFLNMASHVPERCHAVYRVMTDFLASEWEIVSLLVLLGHPKGSGRQILTAASWRAKSLANYVYKQSNQPCGSYPFPQISIVASSIQ